MLRGDLIVFDEFVVAPSLTVPVYTPNDFNSALGGSDVLSVFVVADQVSAPGGNLLVALEHSADGRLWLAKNSGALEIGGMNNGLTAGATGIIWGYSKGTNPSLAEGRLKIYFSATFNAHLRIHVSSRDPR